MTPLDLALLNLDAINTYSESPHPRYDVGSLPNNAPRLCLIDSWETAPLKGDMSRLLPTSKELWHAQGELESQLPDNFLAILTFSPPAPDIHGLPQRYTAPEASPTQTDRMVYAPRLTSTPLPFLRECSLRAPGIPPAHEHGDSQATELCITPALLHAPTSQRTPSDISYTPMDTFPTALQSMASRSSQKGRASSIAPSRTHHDRLKPYTLLSRSSSASSCSSASYVSIFPSVPSFTSTYDEPPVSPTPVPHVVVCARRNAAVPTPEPGAEPVPQPIDPDFDPWQCPHCPYVQVSHRKADLKRHIGTHTNSREAENALWVCCGVPLEDVRSGQYGIEAIADMRTRMPFDFHGIPMVGGCRKAFSRGDALRRHLRKRKGKRCLGDEKADWQPGNNIRKAQ